MIHGSIKNEVSNIMSQTDVMRPLNIILFSLYVFEENYLMILQHEEF